MERADHIPAQDHSRWRGQELRHPRGTTGRCSQRNSGPGQRHSLAPGETEWSGRAGDKTQEAAISKGRRGEAAIGPVMTSALRPGVAPRLSCVITGARARKRVILRILKTRA